MAYTADYLTKGFNYQFRVRAINARGASDASASSDLFITALVPSVPLALDLVSRGSGTITFKWEAPTDNGGLELTGFKIYIAQGSGEYLEVVSSPTELNPTILTYTSTGLTAGLAYKVEVSAFNPIGEGLRTDHIFVFAADLPQSPVNPPSVFEFS